MKKQHFIDLKAIAWDAMQKYGFEPGFSKAVMGEVDKIDESSIPDAGKVHGTFAPFSGLLSTTMIPWISTRSSTANVVPVTRSR